MIGSTSINATVALRLCFSLRTVHFMYSCSF